MALLAALGLLIGVVLLIKSVLPIAPENKVRPVSNRAVLFMTGMIISIISADHLFF